MKILLIIGLIVAAIAGVVMYFVYGTNTGYEDVPTIVSEETLTCNDGTEIHTQYYDNDSLVIEIEGVPYELSNVPAASGARYASSDESFVFWNRGNESTVLVEDEVLFESCQTDAAIEEEERIEEEITDPDSETDPVTAVSDLIQLESPQPEEVIESPLAITGEARGNWYFEATFPIVLTNWDGLIIAEGFATADGEWMTEEFVPFTAELEFENPYTEDDPDFMQSGSLILQRANASGLPKNDAALEIPVQFAE